MFKIYAPYIPKEEFKMLVKITKFSMGLIKRSAEIDLYELFGNEKAKNGERIAIKCVLSPNDCESTTCYVSGRFSNKFLSIVKEFGFCTIEFDNYIFNCSVVSEDEMLPVEERMCFFDFRGAISYSMEEDERWWSPDLEGKKMIDLH